MTAKKKAAAAPERSGGTLALAGDGGVAILYMLPALAGLVVFILGPLVASLWLSMTNWSLSGGLHFVGIENYVRLFAKDRVFWRVLQNTLIVTLVFVPLNLMLAMLMALWLRTPMKGRTLLRIVFLLPCLTPMVANALVWRFILAENGLVNVALGRLGIEGPVWLGSGGWALASIIILSLWQSFGYNMIVLAAGLAAINPQVLEAARIDGAGPFARFWHITLPMVSPSLFFCAVMTMIAGFQIFVQPYTMTKGGPGQDTNTLVLYLYQNAFSYDSLGYASAIGWIVFALVMVVTALQFTAQRRWVHYDQ